MYMSSILISEDHVNNKNFYPILLEAHLELLQNLRWRPLRQ